jgi:CheY-like chemotaxis protein
MQSDRHVLVIEDHADSRQMLCDSLESVGIPCIVAADGQAGLQEMVRRRPSLILLDLMMPGMDGCNFRDQRRLLEYGELASIPIVVLTARPDAHDHASRLGAAAVLTKPIARDRLLENGATAPHLQCRNLRSHHASRKPTA